MLYTKSQKKCREISQNLKTNKREITNPKFPNFDHSLFTLGDLNDFSFYVLLFLYEYFESFIDLSDVRKTFNYIFTYIKKAHFVFLDDQSCIKHFPFSNYYFQNPFFDSIFFDKKDRVFLQSLRKKLQHTKSQKDIQKYFVMERLSNKYVYNKFIKNNPHIHRNIFLERRNWVPNGCFFRPERYEGDKFYNLYDFFLNKIHENIKKSRKDTTKEVNSYLFFMNIRDFPISTKNKMYPYTHITKKKKLEYTPESPILSLCTTDDHEDIPIPTPDDLIYIYDEVYFPPLACDGLEKKKLCLDWNKKVSRVVFRGSLTGCFTNSENSRIKGHEITKDFPDMFDYGITNLNQRLKKHSEDSPLTYYNSTKIKLSSKLTATQISGHKYILVLEGHVAAFRIAYQLSMKSCLLIQGSKYKLWYSDLLKPFEHFVPIKHDLSDLVEKTRWCMKNESTCKKIAYNGHHLSQKILTEEFAMTYMKGILENMCRFSPNPITSEKKIAIITIYRDSSKSGYRKKQLDKFLKVFQKEKMFDIYVIEQSPNHDFNIGFLKNIGFSLANDENKYDHFIFSDIDLIPDDELFEYYTTPPLFPISAAVRGTLYESPPPSKNIKFYEKNYKFNKPFYGGVCIFDKKTFLNINGYPNQIWGWGGEDDILMYRVIKKFKKINYPLVGRVIDLEDHFSSFKKKRTAQKSNNENMNKLKNEMYHAYQFDTFFKEDGIHNFKAYIKSLKKKKNTYENTFWYVADLKMNLRDIKESPDYKNLQKKFLDNFKNISVEYV